MKALKALVPVLCFAAFTKSVLADDVVPTRDLNVDRVFPSDPELEFNNELSDAYRQTLGELERMREQGAETSQATREQTAETQDKQPPKIDGRTNTPVIHHPVVRGTGIAQGARFYAPATAVQDLTTLLAGSFVKARLVSGVEANTIEPYPVLLQLDHAFTGPNRTSVDLSHCFVIAKAKANLSTERVLMETERMSCVLSEDRPYEARIKGFTAGMDSTFGSTGTLISKQGQVLLAAVLASVAKNAGEALASAQQVTEATGLEHAATATNVTGNKAAFVAGRSVVDGAAMVADWYLNYAKQLLPSIAVGSGADVHVVLLESVQVPLTETTVRR
jgi:hypothetical protein